MSWTRTSLFALSAVVLYQALRVSTMSLPAAAGLIVSVLALFIGVFGPSIPKIEALREKVPLIILTAGLSLQFAELLRTAMRESGGLAFPRVVLIAGLMTCAALALAAAARFVSGKTWFVAVVALHFILGIAYLDLRKEMWSDVLVFQQDSSSALLHGQNPYLLTFPNVLGEAGATTFYGPGMVVDGRVMIGFPYPPVSLFLCLPGYLVTGDVRYAHLTAISLAGLLIGLSGRGVLSKLAAVLFLFSPNMLTVFHDGYTEAFVVLLLCAVIFQCRTGRSTVLALGLLFASKQYIVLAIPLVWLLLRDRSLRAYYSLILRIALVGLAVTLPLALWNFKGFFQSIVMTQILQPFRLDALSFPAFFVRLGLPKLPLWLPFAAVFVAEYFLLKRLRPSRSGFAAALAAVHMVFFSLNKQAFLNYYFLVAACLSIAIAAADGEDPPALETVPPA